MSQTTIKYAPIILSHGRPDKVLTIKSLRKSGYSGDIFILIDDEDTTKDEYIKNFGEEFVFVFKKSELDDAIDLMDNFEKRNTVTFARNKIWDIAREIGLTHFIMLDDDYTHFNYRFDGDFRYISSKPIRNIDSVFRSMIDFIDNTKVSMIAFAQGGDFIGGKNGGMAEAVKTKRKVMNVYICRTDNRVEFYGRLNDDVNTYIRHGIIGKILLTTTQVCVEQLQTQSNSGGLTDMYLEHGTYNKSFTSVIASPSSVKINLMGNKHKRLHHVISWDKTVPKIIKEGYKKI